MNLDIQECQISATSETSRQPLMPTSSPYRFPALTSLLLEKVRELKASIAGYGLRPRGLLGAFAPGTSLLKTAQGSLFEDCTRYLDCLPPSGIMQNGRVFQARSSVSSNSVKGYILLPTVLKSTMKGAMESRFFGSLEYRSQLHEFIRDGPQDGIYPNPELTEALMTFPVGYTDLQVQEMPSYL